MEEGLEAVRPRATFLETLFSALAQAQSSMAAWASPSAIWSSSRARVKQTGQQPEAASTNIRAPHSRQWWRLGLSASTRTSQALEIANRRLL